MIFALLVPQLNELNRTTSSAYGRAFAQNLCMNAKNFRLKDLVKMSIAFDKHSNLVEDSNFSFGRN